MKYIYFFLIILCIASPVNATITLYYDDDYTGRSGDLPCDTYIDMDYNAPCISGLGETAKFVSTTPRNGGGEYIELTSWPYTNLPCDGNICASPNNDRCQCAYEVIIDNSTGFYGTTFSESSPISLVSGRTYFLGVFFRLDRTDGSLTDLFHDATTGTNESYDKFIEMYGSSFRWIIATGWPEDWFGGVSKDHHFTINSICPTYYCTNAGYEKRIQNYSPYGNSNPYMMHYETWYSVVMAVKYNGSSSNGLARIWVNGTQIYEESLITGTGTPTITMINSNGTWSQSPYDTPARKVLMDRPILIEDTDSDASDGIDYLTSRGYFSDPEGGTTTTTSAEPTTTTSEPTTTTSEPTTTTSEPASTTTTSEPGADTRKIFFRSAQ